MRFWLNLVLLIFMSVSVELCVMNCCLIVVLCVGWWCCLCWCCWGVCWFF